VCSSDLGRVATTPVSASIIGAIQAQEAMKIIHSEEIEAGAFASLVGNMFYYEGKHTQAANLAFNSYQNNECISHEYWENIIEMEELSTEKTVGETLQILKENLGVNEVTINLRNNKFVDYLSSRSDNTKYMAMMPESLIPNYIDEHKDLEYLSIKDGGLYQHAFENIDDEFPYPELTLKQIGIAYLAVLQTTTENGYAFVELSGDKKHFKDLFCL
jgi:adenylyltransferase/sulfurtransferase